MKTSTEYTKPGAGKLASTYLEDKGHKEAAFGIDLGTTNSCISIVQAGRTPVVVELDDGSKIMPSCIMWKGKPGEFIVGKEAYDNRYKSSAAYSVKRLMGSGKLVTLKYGRKTLTMTPAEVSAEVLKALVRKASSLYKDIKNVVITVPAYFNNQQVSDTIESAKLAGLNLLSILREPTAAMVAYGVDRATTGKEVCMVYDLGGGTWDVSIVRLNVKENASDLGFLYEDASENGGSSSETILYTVLYTGGDSNLGGDDIDMELYKILEQKMDDAGIDVAALPKEEKGKLLLRLERYKKSGVAQYTMTFNYKLKKDGKKGKTQVVINPEDFRQAAWVVYRRTKKIMDPVVEEVGKDSIGSIVLVGGSTKSVFIKEFLARDFKGIRINDSLNPDESVAQGAAVQAKEILFKGEDIEVFDVLPIAIGIESSGKMRPIIKKNTRVPSVTTASFQTVVDNQESVKITILQGNTSLLEEALPLKDFIVSNLPAKPAGEVRVHVTLGVDTNGLLFCEIASGNEHLKGEVVNLFKGDSTGASTTELKEDRRVLKWRKLANKFSADVKAEILSAVDKFVAGEFTLEQVSAVITKHSNVEVDSRKYIPDPEPSAELGHL